MNTMTQIQVVEAFATTTLTKTAFAAEHGISTRTLGRWVEKFNSVTANDAEEVIEVLAATTDPVVVVEETPVVETNDAIVVPVVEEVIAEVVETPVVVEEKTNKRALAAAAYFGNIGMKRKDMIALMVATCGLTAAGASTYISNFKTGKWTA